jgi:hypothetical protein
METDAKVLVESNDPARSTVDGSSSPVVEETTAKSAPTPASTKENLLKPSRGKQRSLLEMMSKVPLKRKSPSLSGSPTEKLVHVSPDSKKLRFDSTTTTDETAAHKDEPEAETNEGSSVTEDKAAVEPSSAVADQSDDSCGSDKKADTSASEIVHGTEKTPSASGKKRGRKTDPESASSSSEV